MQPTPETSQWFALRTRSRTERKAGERLDRAGVEVFTAAPLQEREWTDRVKRVRVPLFPGYIFARFPPLELTPVLGVPGVVDVVRMGGRPAPVRAEELEALHRMVNGVEATGHRAEAVDPLERGDPVRVTAGPFEGLEGILLDDPRGSRVAVRIEALRQARAIRLHREWVTPL
jgi:transcription antitermination factor NusG